MGSGRVIFLVVLLISLLVHRIVQKGIAPLSIFLAYLFACLPILVVQTVIVQRLLVDRRRCV